MKEHIIIDKPIDSLIHGITKTDYYEKQKVFISRAGVIGRELVKILSKQGADIYVGDLEPIPADFPKNIKYRRGDLNYLSKKKLMILILNFSFISLPPSKDLMNP